MEQIFVKFALAAVIACSLGNSVVAQAREDAPQRTTSPFVTSHPVLQASLNRIFTGSASWRDAAAAVLQTERRAWLVTPSDPIMRTLAKVHRVVCDPCSLAEVAPLLDAEAQVAAVLIVVNLPLLQQFHDARLSVPHHFEADLDRILVHEIYGHGVPYLLAGNLSGRCSDPRPGERPSSACSIRRENIVRTELGLGRRDDAGLSSLSLAWGLLARN